MNKYLKISIVIVLLSLLFYFITNKTISKNMKLSDNFNLSEFEHSETAEKYNIDNSVPQILIPRIKLLTEKVLQPTRNFMKSVITITSGYRAPKLSKKLLELGYDVSSTSDHPKGFAADIITSDNKKAFEFIRDNLDFDQLIWEKGNSNQPKWIHVSYRGEGKNRNQVLFM